MRITTPPLSRETTEKVLAIIRQDVNEDKIRIDNPTQNLESYFLGVVQRARESAQTSGATSGGKVAAYLAGDGETESREAQTNKLLERLTAPAAPMAVPVAEAAPAARAVDMSKLDALTKAAPAAPFQPASSTAPVVSSPAQSAEDVAKANEKLSSLLGGKK
jgi:hypothetical protein